MSKTTKNAGISAKQTTTTFPMPTDEHHAFKIALVKNNESMAGVLRDAIKNYVEQSNASK